MSQLPAQQAIDRFKANEERVDKFVNESGTWTTSGGTSVETLQAFLNRKDAEVDLHFGVLVHRGNWATATAYQRNDIVAFDYAVYLCVESHTAGTFSTDLAAGKWILYRLLQATVYDFGAVGNFNISTWTGNDDTTAFVSAVAWARPRRRSVLVPTAQQGKAFYVNDTLQLTNGDFFGASLIGENAEGSKIATDLSGTNPVVYLRGGSGTATNARCEHLTFVPHVAGQGVAIKVNGQDLSSILDIHADNFNYGVHLINDTGPGTFTELTLARQLWINNCNSNIKIEVGAGDASFHGTTFDDVFMNVGNGQIGLDIGPGCYVYNSRFNIHFWGAAGATLIKNRGNVEHCVANFTYENAGAGAKIDNGGRFHAHGYLMGIGTLLDISTAVVGSGSEMLLDNYFKPQTPTNSNLAALGITSLAALSKMNPSVNGFHPNILRFTGPNIEGVAVDVYGGGTSSNGLALIGTGFQGALQDATLYHLLGKSDWRTFNSALRIMVNGEPATQFQLNSSGLHSGKMGRQFSGVVSANAGVQQTITTTGYGSASVIQTASLVIVGSNYEWRGLVTINHNGYGGNGTVALLATHYVLNSAGVSFNSATGLSVDSSGNLKVTLTTDRNLTVTVKTVGIGDY